MTRAKARHYCVAWVRNLASVQALGAVLSAFGVLWLAVESTSFFFANTTWPATLQEHWPWFAIAGLLVAFWLRRPHLSVSHKLDGRDVVIEIAIGDVFDFPGAIIVGSNTTFDTKISQSLISERTIQGQFTRAYYADETLLDRDLNDGLNGITCETLSGKRMGKSNRYPMGTCVRVNPKLRTGYLIAIAHMNEHGVASGNFNDLKDSLARLWVFIGSRGLKESLVMPVLGTGFTRLKQTREEVVREMIRSFIAACSASTFADRLTIVIYPPDVVAHRISLDDLGSFLRHECRYVSFVGATQQALGTPA